MSSKTKPQRDVWVKIPMDPETALLVASPGGRPADEDGTGRTDSEGRR